MDAKTFVSVQINRLQDLLSEAAKTNNPTFIEQVVTAIKCLHSLEQSLQVSERPKKVSSVVKVIYSAEDITDSLLLRKRENEGFTRPLLDKKESQPTKKRENNGFKKKLQWPLTYLKSLHSQDEFALELEKFRAEITDLFADCFCSNPTLSFLNEEGQQSQQQCWGKFSGYCSEETSVGGFEQQIKDLVARLIPEMDCNRHLSSTRDHSSEGIMEIPAEQDGDDHYIQVVGEIGEGGSDKTNNNHCDENPSDLDPSNDQPSEKNCFWMSLRSACERGHFIIPGIIFVVKTYLRLRRFLRKTVITLRQSIIDTTNGQEGNHSANQVIAGVSEEIRGDQISEQDGKNSNNHVIGAVGKEILEEQILEKNVNKSINQVIAVVGEAGSGKSTMVTTVYNRNDVKQHFTIRACVRVSSESKARDVLLSILKQTKDDVSDSEKPSEMKETLSEKELISHLKKRLKDINYLIVIEDVETPKVWRAVRDALNDSSCHRGNIIITSRNPNATLDADSTLRMHPLNNEESWKLFLEKAQLAEDPEVMRTSKENILKICGGLPLRIVWLGGLLSTKELADWSSMRVRNEIPEDILASLMYKDLPSQVKPCFLYMALFPKGHEIPVRRLIHLWCAEGFVTPLTYKEMVPRDLAEKILPEDLAEIYFLVLVIRNMIQVRWKLDGSPKTCRMHDHLHEIFSQRAADVGFFYHDRSQQFHTAVQQAQFAVRRLGAAYLDNNIYFPSTFLDLRHLRSCVVFDKRGVPDTPANKIDGFFNKIFVNRDFGLLNVLDLEGVYKPKLSNAVLEKLLQLRYLGLRSTSIDSLPSFVGFLPYLETLDLKKTGRQNLPPSIWKAKKLQHLYLDWSHSETVVDSSFSKSLSNLSTLWALSIKDDSNGKFNFQLNFSRLRKLGLNCHSASALKIITQLTQLQSLKVKYAWNDGRQCNSTAQTHIFEIQLQESAARHRQTNMEKISVQHLQLQRMEKLQNLYLMGKLEKQVIDNRSLPPNLRMLTLAQSRLEEDPMPLLEKLRGLKVLRLFAESYVGEKIKCSLPGFPGLHVLKLKGLRELKEWTVEEGAMPCLQQLEITECNQLQVPRELQHYLPGEGN